MVERRHNPSESESLSLLSQNLGDLADILLPQVLQLGGSVGEIKSELKSIRELAEKALVVSEDAAKRIEAHTSEWQDWKKVIILSEKERHDRQFWVRVWSVTKTGIAWVAAVVIGLFTLVSTVDNGWQHLKSFWPK